MCFSVSCTPSGESSGNGGWVLFVFLLIPLTVLGLLIYRYCAYPEPIVWTEEDIEEYNRKKAEELGEEYKGQDYTDEEEDVERPKRYQVLWSKIKTKIYESRNKRRERKKKEYLFYKRMREGDELIKQLGLEELNETIIINNNGKGDAMEDIDNIDLNDIDIDALLRD